MTKEQVKAVLDRVLSWPPDRQQDAVDMLTLMEAQEDRLRLTEDQVEEVRRRLNEKDPEILSLEEFDQRLRRFGL